KSGYKSSVQMLPAEVKRTLDRLMLQRMPIIEVLRLMSQKYPDVPMPSKSSLYNYRNKHFPTSMVAARPVQTAYEKEDTEKVLLKTAILQQIRQYVIVDLPQLRSNFSESY